MSMLSEIKVWFQWFRMNLLRIAASGWLIDWLGTVQYSLVGLEGRRLKLKVASTLLLRLRNGHTVVVKMIWQNEQYKLNGLAIVNLVTELLCIKQQVWVSLSLRKPLEIYIIVGVMCGVKCSRLVLFLIFFCTRQHIWSVLFVIASPSVCPSHGFTDLGSKMK